MQGICLDQRLCQGRSRTYSSPEGRCQGQLSFNSKRQSTESLWQTTIEGQAVNQTRRIMCGFALTRSFKLALYKFIVILKVRNMAGNQLQHPLKFSCRLFYQRFFPVETISFCASDPSDRWWAVFISTTSGLFLLLFSFYLVPSTISHLSSPSSDT